jgi:hypothetical protein
MNYKPNRKKTYEVPEEFSGEIFCVLIKDIRGTYVLSFYDCNDRESFEDGFKESEKRGERICFLSGGMNDFTFARFLSDILPGINKGIITEDQVPTLLFKTYNSN